MKKAGNFVAIDGAQPGIQYRIDGGEMGVFYKKTGGAGNYEELSNKPKINGETVVGIKEGKDYNLQDLLIAGPGIVIEDNDDHTATISATGDKFFEHTQSVPAQEWQIEHNLQKFPSVTVIDSGDSVVVGDIQYIDTNNIILSFQSAFAGKAYLN